MSNQTEKQNKRKGLAVSITVHAVLLVLLAFVGLSYSTPPPEEGMLVNFGFDETGLGDVESEPMPSEQTETEEAVTPTNQAEAAASEEALQTQETEASIQAPKKTEAEVVKPKQPTEEEIKKKEQERVEAEKRKATDALFSKAKSGTGTGQGNTKPGGNQGDPDGVANAPYGSGAGSGKGLSFNLSGRRILAPPQVKDNSQKVGKVVVDIVVDRTGKVVIATPGGRGSTTTDSYLYGLARQAAMDTKFTASPDALQQKGTITFDFVVE